MTYGREIHGPNIKKINRLKIRNLIFTAPSEFCKKSGNVAGIWRTISNSIEFEKYDLIKVVSSDAPLIFLSRLERLKGAHEAIEIALVTGENLIIAGNISKLPEELDYFKTKIEPFIDGSQIKYVGVLNDEQKNVFLGMSKAMLFPARTEEAFGMVMVESMACGTPVIAYDYAAMPEVVDHGITGFIVSNKMEMVDKIKKIVEIDREKCRQRAELRFDVKKIAQDYLSLH
jgi:glycosyltransferase involved in cell wall biosynthesis